MRLALGYQRFNKRRVWQFCLWAVLLGLTAGTALAQEGASEPAAEPFVVVCPLNGMVDDGMAVIVKRAVQESQGAALMIFELDTPGGLVDAAVEISDAILSARCPTVAYVKGMGAISAGALLAYSCDVILMAPATAIGASEVVGAGGADLPAAMNRKATSFLLARYRALAEENKHNPLLAMAMVNPNIELRARREANGVYTIYEVSPEQPSEELKSEEEKVQKIIRDLTKDSPLDGPLGDLLGTIIKEAVKEMEKKNRTQEQPGEMVVSEGEVLAEGEAAVKDAPKVLDDGSELVCARGDLLTLTTKEALRYGLAPASVANVSEVLGFMDKPNIRRVIITPTWSESLFRWLTSPFVSGFILLLGLACLYIEFKTPGVMLPGVVGLVCLAIFFGSHYVIGLASWLDIALVLAGVGLILVEVFILPGFGMAGISGVLMLMLGLYLSLTRVTVPVYSWDFQRLEDAGATVFTAFGLFLLLAAFLWRYLPRSPLGRMVILRDTQQESAGYVVQTGEQETAALGQLGVATTMLRPAGRGRFGNTTYDVITRGEFVKPRTPLVIIEASSNRYVVAEETGDGRKDDSHG